MSAESRRFDRPTLFLLDGHALIYRAFYAMISRPLTTSSGENTSAPFGLARFLIKVLEEHEPDYLGVVFDAGDSFRTEVLPEYKATRTKMPDELAASLPRCRDIIEGFRIPVIEVEGWEADDVIGTLAVKASATGLQTVIISGDKDFYQLIRPEVVLLNPGRGGSSVIDEEWITPENAAERLGVPPERVTDYLALIGDSSDNIPGVRGIGEKTAPKLIRTWGSLEDILAHAEDVSGTRARNALLEHGEEARLSKELVTIRTDAPVELELEKLARERPDRQGLRDIFLELEFFNLLRDYAPEEPEEREVRVRYELVAGTDGLEAALRELREGERLALHLEGTGPDAVRAEPVGLALSAEAGRAFYLPLGHRPPSVSRDEEGNPTLALESEASVANLPPLESEALAGVRELLCSAVPKVSPDLKYALVMLERAGCRLGGLEFDTAIASYCLDPGKRDHGIDLLVVDRFGHKLVERAALTGSGAGAIPFAEVDPADALCYAAERADYALRIRGLVEDELERHAMRRLFEEVEMPLLRVLAAMERAGIRIDLGFFAELEARLDRELRLVKEEIEKLAGVTEEELNLRSVPQLRELLFDRMGLPVVKRTKTGPSTDESVLQELAARGHEIPRLILEHRELDKLAGTYVSKLPALVNPATGRLHSSFNQTVAATGRLSSSEPNLQNIPIRSVLGREIRKGFVPEEGWRFLSADYSQIELRVMAHLSGDPAFVEAFRADRDIHRETAARIFGIDSDRVTPDMRARAKTINFATIYGQGPVALASQLGIGRRKAREFIDQYFERFSGVAAYLERMKEEARARGYVETLIGRRRYIPEIRSRNPGVRGFGERTATNSPIQGTAADLIKIAMIRLHRRLAELNGDGKVARLLLQVHDELLFEVREGAVDAVREVVREEMEGAIELDVPLRVDLGVGGSWFACK